MWRVFLFFGIAGVPGVLRATIEGEDGKTLTSGCLDAGYPLSGKLRQAQFVLPKGTKFAGSKLRAEIEVKGRRYPVQWACRRSSTTMVHSLCARTFIMAFKGEP